MVSLVLAALLAADPGAPAASPPPAASPGLDTVHLTSGGRARGTVVEDDPATGVTIQLADGTFRRFPRSEIKRVEYGGEPAAPPPAVAPPPPAAPPPPMAVPPAEDERPARDPMAPASMTLALGGSGAGTSGSVSEKYGSTSKFWSGFGQLDLEAGVRVTPATTLLLQVDLGGGDAAGGLKSDCAAGRLDCSAATFRIGVAARYAFMPMAKHTPWVSAGIGREGTGVTVKGPQGDETIAFGGWEWLKLGAGWDLRFSRSFGLGAFAGFSLGTYNAVSASGTSYFIPGDLGGSRTHTWFQVGARAILFP
jgi:hypothetical protein